MSKANNQGMIIDNQECVVIYLKLYYLPYIYLQFYTIFYKVTYTGTKIQFDLSQDLNLLDSCKNGFFSNCLSVLFVAQPVGMKFFKFCVKYRE